MMGLRGGSHCVYFKCDSNQISAVVNCFSDAEAFAAG